MFCKLLEISVYLFCSTFSKSNHSRVFSYLFCEGSALCKRHNALGPHKSKCNFGWVSIWQGGTLQLFMLLAPTVSPECNTRTLALWWSHYLDNVGPKLHVLLGLFHAPLSSKFVRRNTIHFFLPIASCLFAFVPHPFHFFFLMVIYGPRSILLHFNGLSVRSNDTIQAKETYFTMDFAS